MLVAKRFQKGTSSYFVVSHRVLSECSLCCSSWPQPVGDSDVRQHKTTVLNIQSHFLAYRSFCIQVGDRQHEREVDAVRRECLARPYETFEGQFPVRRIPTALRHRNVVALGWRPFQARLDQIV